MSEHKSVYRQGYEKGFDFPELSAVEETHQLKDVIKDLPDQQKAEFLLGFRDGKVESYFNRVAGKVNVWSVDKNTIQFTTLFHELSKVLERFGIV